MELVDVADSKSAASDSVPVRLRSPAPRQIDPNRFALHNGSDLLFMCIPNTWFLRSRRDFLVSPFYWYIPTDKMKSSRRNFRLLFAFCIRMYVDRRGHNLQRHGHHWGGFVRQNHRCGWKMSLLIAAYFYATNRNINYRNRVGKWKHPQGIALMSLTARSAVFFIYLSNT